MKLIYKKLLCIVVFALFAVFAKADRFEVNGVYYETDASNADIAIVVKKPSGYYQESSYIIPNTVLYGDKSLRVVRIGESAFFLSSNLSSITLPNSITEIGNSAFRSCSKLPSITLPASLISIGDEAFSGCESLESLIIPQKVVKLGSSFLYGCDALETLQVESGNAIYNSEGNCNAVIETGTKTLIAGCKSSVIPESVEYIGANAFSRNAGLTSIIIPNSVKGIRDKAFFLCSNLRKVTMSESVMEIGNYAFRGCSNLLFIVFPASLTKIGSDAFSSCEKLTEIVSYIENPFAIEDNVFHDYKNTIYSSAILYVPQDKISTYRNLGGWNKFVNIQGIQPDPTVMIGGLTYTIKKLLGYAILSEASSDVKHARIRSSIDYETVEYPVEIIEDALFANNTSLISVSIPQSIRVIGQNILKDCNHLAAIDWQCDIRPSSELVSNIKNPNLLFYVSSLNIKPDGIRNVIVNGIAENIALTDEEYGDFFCPIEFTANKITYTHKYGLKTEPGVCQGWESIALPFDVQTYMTPKGEAKPYMVANTGERLFWLRELKEGGMTDSEGIKANVPFIISMPNWEGYQDFYNIEGDMVFSSQNVTIGKTDIQPVSWNGRQFWPCYEKKSNYYALAAINKEFKSYSNTTDTYLPGSVFIVDHRDIQPFEAYIAYDSQSSVRPISIEELCRNTTSVQQLNLPERIYSIDGKLLIDSNSDKLISIYSICGNLIKTIRISKGHNEFAGLDSGIFIIDGKKIVIK